MVTISNYNINYVLVHCGYPQIMKKVKGLLTYSNPSWFIISRRMKYISPEFREENQYFKLYVGSSDSEDYILVLKGNLDSLIEKLITFKITYILHESISLDNDKTNIAVPFNDIDTLWSFMKEHFLSDMMGFRYYQVEPLLTFLQYYRGINETGTGGGKTPFMYYLSRIFQDCFGFKNILIIVPMTALVGQTIEKFVLYTKDSQKDEIARRTKGLGGTFKSEKLKFNDDLNILISTFQSLNNRDEDFFTRFDLIIADEVHRASCKSIQKVTLNSVNAFFRYGLTATMKENSYEAGLIRGIFGKTLYVKEEKELIDEGFLSHLKVICVNSKYIHNHSIINIIHSKGFSIEDEIRYVNSRIEKLKLVKEVIEISKSSEKNVLIVCHHLDFLYKMVVYNKMMFPDREIIVIHGNLNNEKKTALQLELDVFIQLNFPENKKELSAYVKHSLNTVKQANRSESIAKLKNTVGALTHAIFQTIDTGVDEANIHTGIVAESVRSFQTVIQFCGRLIRPQDGKNAELYDIQDNICKIGSRGGVKVNKLYSQALDRKDHYIKEQHEVTEMQLTVQ